MNLNVSSRSFSSKLQYNMGGEWVFNIKPSVKDNTFPLMKYQMLLMLLKQEYKDEVGQWSSIPVAAETNVFAYFSYPHNRHTERCPTPSPDNCARRNYWYLYWDPTIVDENLYNAGLGARDSAFEFNKACMDLQMNLVSVIGDEYFELYIGDGYTGYS